MANRRVEKVTSLARDLDDTRSCLSCWFAGKEAGLAVLSLELF